VEDSGRKEGSDLHEVEFMTETSPSLSDGSGIAQHADSTLHLRQVASRDGSGRLGVDSNLETSWTPVREPDPPKYIKIQLMFSL
jgi:hypothetical protein